MIKPILKPGRKPKPGKTQAEKAHLDRVASLGCIICGAPACIHHVRQNASKRDHMRVIPLCHYHHQGQEGLHHLGRAEWVKRYGKEIDLLEIVRERLIDV